MSDDQNQPIAFWVNEGLDVECWIAVAKGRCQETGAPKIEIDFKDGTPTWDRLAMLETALARARQDIQRVVRRKGDG